MLLVMQKSCRKGHSNSILASNLAWDIMRCFVSRSPDPSICFAKPFGVFQEHRWRISYGVSTILPTPPFSANCCASLIWESLSLLLMEMENNPRAISLPSTSNLAESGLA